MAIYADLHTHTSCSDGLDAPMALLRRARSRGVSAISITDHDTLSAYSQARPAALELGIELVTGVEISTFHNGGNVHILGYFLDDSSQAALRLVEGNSSGRVERMKLMLARIGALGYKVDFEELKSFTGQATIGRMALARFMVKSGFFGGVDEAFYKLLGDGKPGFEPMTRFTPTQAIEHIATAGGLSSLAHPGESMDEKSLDEFAAAGLDAVEAVTPHHSAATVRRWRDMASSRGLAISGGSDCHGPIFGYHDVGAAGLKIDEYEEFRARAKQPACVKTASTGGGDEIA